ncbi:MAG: two-component regulator propeller domain-containing protein [Verrucomicrobiota bacterium]
MSTRRPQLAWWFGRLYVVGLLSSSSIVFPLEIVPRNAERDYVIQSWRSEHGLPSNTIHDVLQTEDGFVWIATSRGLARFDGLNIRVFEGSPDASLRNLECRKLAQGTHGELWVGTSEGLFRIVGSAYRRYTVTDGLPADEVTELLAVATGELWVGTLQGLAQIRDGIVRRVETGKGRWNEINDIYISDEGTISVATALGILHLDPKSMTISHERDMPFQGTLAVKFDEAVSLAAGGELLWEKTSQGWIQRTDLSTTLDRNVFFRRDYAGALWFWDLTKGLIRMDATDRFVSYAVPNLDTREFRPTCFFPDRERGYWIGTSGAGIQRWHPRLVHSYAASTAAAYSLLAAADGSVWVGTEEGLIRVGQDGTTVWTEALGLAHNSVRALAEDRQGRIWIGTLRGLHFLEKGNLGQLTFAGEWAANKIRALLVARDRTLWVGSVVGLHRVRDGIIAEPFNSSSALSRVEVRELHQATDGRIWIGTAAEGLYAWDGTELAHYTVKDGLSNDSIWSVCESTDGALWFGTERGLTCFSKGKFSKIFMDRGLPDDQISQLLSSGSRIWLGTTKGLFGVEIANLHAAVTGSGLNIHGIQIDENDGIRPHSLAGELSQNPCLRLRSGELLFCATNGVLRLRANNSEPLTAIAPSIQSLRAGDFLLYDGVTSSASLPEAEKIISIPPEQRSLVQVTYAAPCFTNPQKVRYKYRLNPLEKDWTEAGPRREAFYTHLPAGQYRFEVVASNSAGIWGDKPAQLGFAIERRFHEKSAFRASALSGIVIFAYAISLWRRRSSRHLQQLEQENALAQERQRLARDLHDDLGADLQQLSLRCHLAAQNERDPRAIQSDVAEIGIAARSALTRLIRTIHLIEPQSATTSDLVQVITELAGTTLGLANVVWTVRTEDPFPSRSLPPHVRHELIVASREALRNVVQHAGAQRVEITMSQSGDWLVIEIADNGNTMFEFAEARDGVAGVNSGRGLQNLRSRMVQMNGEFAFRRTESGSVVKFCVPLSKEAQ